MKNTIYRTLRNTCILLLLVALSSFTLKQIVQKEEPNQANNGFAVLELFTSQGCSSCPPADNVLSKYVLQNNPNIIPLAFHVDYWNRLGWKDPFSKSEFSERQSNYANFLNTRGNYTPQLIINGKYEIVGSKENEINNLVKKELGLLTNSHLDIKKASISKNGLDVEYDAENNPNTSLNLALVKKKEFTNIKSGENSGLKQTNYNIVFDFKTVSSASNAESFEFKKEWLTSDYFVVVYLQNNKTGKVLAASKSEIK